MTTRKSILFCSETGGFFGGVERFIFKAALSLRSAGFCCLGSFVGPGRESEAFAAAFDEVRFGGDAAGELAGRADLLWVHKLRDCRAVSGIALPKVVYVHDFDYTCFRRHKYFPVGRVNCPLPSNALWCYGCGMASHGHLEWRTFSRNLSFLREADRVLAGSDFMLGHLKSNRIAPEKLGKLPPLIDLGDRMLPVSGRCAGELLYVGQLIPGKGVDLLLRACALLSVPWHLTVVGDGVQAGFLRGLAGELGIADRVDWVGFTPEPERFLESAAVAVFPSRWQEPFGMTGPEAMARGIPVVGFDVGGVSEWLKNGVNGLLVKPGRISELAGALERLLKDPASSGRLGGVGREAMRAFTGERFAERFTELCGGLW